MRFVADCYRAHDPKWAFSPLSGDGAALHGGRFNPVGTPALYLALTIDGMFCEMSHGFARRFEPLTVCTYSVDIDHIVDLRTDSNRAVASTSLPELGCPWKADHLAGRTPASWLLASRLKLSSAKGVLVPSFATGARSDHVNLVLWRWGPNLPHKVTVHDPSGRLPKNQLSWT